MNHLSEEELILHFYGEADGSDTDRSDIERSGHVNACVECREKLAALSHVLHVCTKFPVPERPPGYEQEVWKRLALTPGKTPTQWSWRMPALAAAFAAMLVAAFLAGRFSQHRSPSIAGSSSGLAKALSSQDSDRFLVIALGDHLERSQMVLVELANAKPGDAANMADEQQRARELVGENRLYRQTAALDGDAAVASVLDDLERALLAIAHSPANISSTELQRIQRHIEEQGILFKIRVLNSNARSTDKL